MFFSTLANIGFVYYNLKNYQEAIKYFLRSLHLKDQANDKSDVDRLLLNIGLCFNELRAFTQANEYLKKAFDTCGGNCSSQIIIEGKYCLGILNFEQRNYDKALKYFKESYNISKRSHDTRFQTENLIHIARINVVKGAIQMAIKNLEEAEMLAESSGYNELAITIYDLFLMVFKKQKRFEKLSSYQQKYIQLKDSIYTQQLTANLMKMEATYKTRESDLQLASQKQILTLTEDSFKGQKKLNITISLVALCLIVIATILFKSNSQRKAINHLLELKVHERTKELEQNRNE